MHNQTFTDDSECSGTTGLLLSQKSPCYTSLYLPALAPGCSSHLSSRHWCLHNIMLNAESLTLFKRHLKTHLFRHHLTLKKKKKKNNTLLPFLNFALFSLNSHRLARICSEQCLEICITNTSYVYLPLYNVLLIAFLNCKSLCIKASAN